jgi:hypothetical protein
MNKYLSVILLTTLATMIAFAVIIFIGGNSHIAETDILLSVSILLSSTLFISVPNLLIWLLMERIGLVSTNFRWSELIIEILMLFFSIAGIIYTVEAVFKELKYNSNAELSFRFLVADPLLIVYSLILTLVLMKIRQVLIKRFTEK